MSDIAEHLRKTGIYPYGSAELKHYEGHLTRYFNREYRGIQGKYPAAKISAIPTNIGPMWEQTDALMEQHFDASLDLFMAFLDSEFMAYTTAYYGATPEQIRSSPLTLEQAEKAKFELICKRAGIQGKERVFPIGCGFGPLETFLLDRYPDLQITSVTPSKTQTGYIRQCMNKPDHPLYQRDLRLIEGDFSAVSLVELGERSYDIVFAVGAFEHINNLDAAFQRIAALLKTEGKAFLHLIVSKPVFPQYHDSENTLLGEFFPGGHIWPFDLIQQQTDYFELENSWYLNGTNYWRTLEEWHRRFWENMDQLYGSVLSDEAVRHWNDYFILCKVVLFGPAEGEIYGNGHFLFRKRMEPSGPCGKFGYPQSAADEPR